MNRNNLFIFIVTHLKQLGGSGRGVIIVRSTPLQQVISEFDQFLQSDQIRQHFQYKKEIDPSFPEMVIYNALEGEEHIVIGKNEQGWKGDYGLTHTDVVVSIH